MSTSESTRFLERANRLWTRIRWIAYPLFTALCVLWVARTFYGTAMNETGGEWSAPLDDVFIHFDYARATARGFPFQWSEGNGYSSGNTSLSYPFVLAFGYWIGFRDQSLMLWAALVACLSTFGYLLVAPRLALGLPRWTRFLIPAAVLSLGALDWSLFSGMEVAFYLLVWAAGLVLCLDHKDPERRTQRSWALGAIGALIVATRPEGATSVFVLGCAAAYIVWNQLRSVRPALLTAVRSGLPAIGLLLVQSLSNRLLTGESAANGALVKLALYNPFMTRTDQWNEYVFHLKYCVLRNIEHHFSDAIPYGWIPLLLAGVALLSKRTRAYALILCCSTVLFILLVATNGQVRWQNERYTMPAVAWLFTASALGLGVLLSQGVHKWMRATWIPRVLCALAIVGLYTLHQAPKMKDQIWFFGRACRNIRDQHIVAGRYLRTRVHPTPRRVLVGDAGAMMYASDLPGLDIIGLGGYHKLPFARAGVAGLGATIELLERIQPDDRPDYMAIYPTWWGKFPLWFGKQVAAVWVEGNVICGGAEKAIYKADWHLLNTGERSFSLEKNERVLDELDTGDLLSEQQHSYLFPRPGAGFVDLRILSYPADLSRDVLDAGRRIPGNRSESFALHLPHKVQHARLLVRTAPTHKGRLDVVWDGHALEPVSFSPTDGWVELSLPIPSDFLTPGPHHVVFTPKDTPDLVNHHVWLVSSQ